MVLYDNGLAPSWRFQEVYESLRRLFALLSIELGKSTCEIVWHQLYS